MGGTVETVLLASLVMLLVVQVFVLVKLCLVVYNLSEFVYFD